MLNCRPCTGLVQALDEHHVQQPAATSTARIGREPGLSSPAASRRRGEGTRTSKVSSALPSVTRPPEDATRAVRRGSAPAFR